MSPKALITRLRRYQAGASMIGFVAALELEDLVDPTNQGTTAQRLRHVAEHPGRLFAASALLFLACVLLIPTVVNVLHLVRSRGGGTGLASAAAGLLTIGAIGHGAVVGLYAVLSAAASHQSPAVIATIDHSGSTAAGALIGVGILCFALGFMLLIGALVRSRLASRWLLLAIPAGLAGRGLGEALGVSSVDLGQLAAVAPLVWLGWRYGTAPGIRRVTPQPGLEPAVSV